MPSPQPVSALQAQLGLEGAAFYEANGIAMQEAPVCSALLLTVDWNSKTALHRQISEILGAPLPAPGCASGKEITAVWQGPQDTLIVSDKPIAPAIMSNLKTSLESETGLITDCSSAITRIRITGDAIREFLSLGVSVDLRPAVLPSGSAVTTRLDAFRVTLVTYENELDLIVNQPESVHLWRWLQDAVDHFVEKATSHMQAASKAKLKNA